jgi:transposase
MSLHANSGTRWSSGATAAESGPLGQCRMERFGDRSSVGCRCSLRSSLEGCLPSPWPEGSEVENCSGSTVQAVRRSALRLEETTASRSRSARVFDGPVDLSAHRSADRNGVPGPLPCRSHPAVDAFARLFRSEAGTPSPRTQRIGTSRLDRSRLEADQKKAATCQGTIVFVDETGIFLTPFVQRTWAPRGQTPILKSRTRHHRHLSVIGGITISPRRRRLGWYLNFHPDQSIRQDQVIAFLRDLLRHIRGEVFLIWDRLNAHRGKQVRSFIAKRSRLHVELLPPYAPELNPNEYGWSYLKCRPLANYCPDDLDELTHTAKTTAISIRTQQDLLRGFVKATGLPIRLKRAG